MAGAEKFCKVRVNFGASATVPYSQLLDLRSAQTLNERAASESTAEFLKGLPSHNEYNFSRFQPDTSFKSSMKRASVYLPTKDHPAEESKLITTDKTTILLRYLQQQYDKKSNQKSKRDNDRAGTSGNSDFTPRKKTRVDRD